MFENLTLLDVLLVDSAYVYE